MQAVMNAPKTSGLAWFFDQGGIYHSHGEEDFETVLILVPKQLAA